MSVDKGRAYRKYGAAMIQTTAICFVRARGTVFIQPGERERDEL